MYTNRRFWQWRRLFFTGLMLALLILSACGSTSAPAPILGHEVEFPPEKQVTISCNTTCAQRGQCGTAVTGSQVVLGGSGPLVANHDRLFQDGTAVTILVSSEQMLEPLQGGEQFPLRFYQIQPEGQQPGWVAGWCLADQ